MSSYTEITLYYGEDTRGILEKNKFPGKVNALQEANEQDRSLKDFIAHRGHFTKLEFSSYAYHGSFNYLDWYRFCDFVKLYNWKSPEKTHLMVYYDYDFKWHHFTIKDILDDNWKNRDEMYFLTKYHGK